MTMALATKPLSALTERYYKVAEVPAFVPLSESEVRRRLENGGLGGIRLSTQSWRVPSSALHAIDAQLRGLAIPEPEPFGDKTFLRIQEAAKLLRIDRRHLTSLIDAGTFPGAVIGKVRFISAEFLLDLERDRIIATLGSKAKLKKLIKDELLADAKKFGDARRSPLVAREAAQALDETELVPSEPVTIVLSQKGWVRAAKGHDIDASALSYREGDKLLAAVKGRTTQQVAFLDSAGRSYSTLAHSLPSARGNGEPLTGRFSPAPGASFAAVASGGNDDRFVLASSHGYGFVTRFENLTGRQKAGKAMLSLSEGAKVLQPATVTGNADDRIVAVTSAGHLLAFPVSELPELDKGKGNKIIEIPKAKRGTERVVAMAVVPPGGTLVVHSGARTMSLSFKDLGEYVGARASRGGLLPRGWQKVDGLHVE
jgi:topoisomerase IV subunit A